MKFFFNYFYTIALLFIIFPSFAKRGSSYPYIAGDTFRSIANQVFDETTQRINISTIKKGDIIFIKTDYLNRFINEIFPAMKQPIIIITHNSDCMVPGSIDKTIFNNFLDNKNIIAMFSQNVEKFQHEKLFSIPIGIANQEWPHGNISIFTRTMKHIPQERPYLLYMNFSPSTYPQERPYIFHLFKDKTFCTVASPKNLEVYLTEMALHKFTISPRGNGIDCHRTWEALLTGSIPIVRKSDLDVLYKDLPVLIIDDWEEITEEFLTLKYSEINQKQYKFHKKFAGYWLKKILNIQKNNSD